MHSAIKPGPRVLRTRVAAVLGLTLLPIAAGIAGLATTDLAFQTRANPPTMGALEVSSATVAVSSADTSATISLVSAPAEGTVYISDLPFIEISNGWGPAERDRSNGERGATDGRTITLNGVTYAKGVGVHAFSEIQVDLNRSYSRFVSDVGLDDEITSAGSVRFEVRGDGSVLYQSPVMYASTATQTVDLDVTGMQQLVLIVADGGDGIGSDHADWAGARLMTASSTTTASGSPTPVTPRGLAIARFVM